MPQDVQCKIELEDMDDEKRERIEGILNTAITAGQIDLTKLSAEDMDELEDLLADMCVQQ